MRLQADKGEPARPGRPNRGAGRRRRARAPAIVPVERAVEPVSGRIGDQAVERPGGPFGQSSPRWPRGTW
jgi:hypothetical protein